MIKRFDVITIKDLVKQGACDEVLKWAMDTYFAEDLVLGVKYKTFHEGVGGYKPVWLEWLDEHFGKCEEEKKDCCNTFNYFRKQGYGKKIQDKEDPSQYWKFSFCPFCGKRLE